MGLNFVATFNEETEFMKSFIAEHGTTIQIVLYGGLLTLLWVVEVFISTEPFSRKWNHSKLNASFTFLTLPVQLLMTLLVVAAATYVTKHHWGLLQILPGSSNPWIKYVLAFVLLDFCDYLYHVIMHKLDWLWRFHVVHHSDQEVDVSTTVREHPGETFVRVCFLFLWVVLLGVGWETLLLRQTVETVSNLTSHSKYRLPGWLDKILGWIFITPNLHHVHHHHRQPFTDCNYGDVFSVWDRLFGTYAELRTCETVFGIDSHPSSQATGNFKEVVMIPFRQVRKLKK